MSSHYYGLILLHRFILYKRCKIGTCIVCINAKLHCIVNAQIRVHLARCQCPFEPVTLHQTTQYSSTTDFLSPVTHVQSKALSYSASLWRTLNIIRLFLWKLYQVHTSTPAPDEKGSALMGMLKAWFWMGHGVRQAPGPKIILCCPTQRLYLWRVNKRCREGSSVDQHLGWWQENSSSVLKKHSDSKSCNRGTWW